MTFDHGRGGAITSIEAFVLAAMTAIVVAIALPAYVAIHDRGNDSDARAQLRQAGDAAEAYRADRGSYTGLSPASLVLYDSKLDASDYRLGSVSARTYCLETTVGGRKWHLVAPAGDLRRGRC